MENGSPLSVFGVTASCCAMSLSASHANKSTILPLRSPARSLPVLCSPHDDSTHAIIVWIAVVGQPDRSVGRRAMGNGERGERSNVKRYGQRHAHGIQYPRLQCCCILIDLPPSVHVPLSRRHKVGLVANILPGPGQQNNNNAISKWQKSPTINWPRMAARRTPACLDLARRKLRFRGVCTAASRKMERLDATVQGEAFGGLSGLKFEMLKICNFVAR